MSDDHRKEEEENEEEAESTSTSSTHPPQFPAPPPPDGGVTSSALPLRDSNRRLDCVVCFGAYDLTDRLPRRLHCGHTFCQTCLRRLDTMINEQTWITCPQCRQNTPMPRGGTGALDLDLVAFLGVKAELDPPRSSRGRRTRSEGEATAIEALDGKPWLGKEPSLSQTADWSHGGLAEPRFHRYGNCCRPSYWLCCWFCCPGRG
ncbi:RING finger protein 224 [Polymixia lowei]